MTIMKTRYNFRVNTLSHFSRALHFLLIGFILQVVSSSCEKLIEVEIPANQLEQATVFNSNTTANSAVAGMYNAMANKGTFNYMLTVYPSMSADEMYYNTSKGFYDQFTNNIISTINNSDNLTLWSDPYSIIYQANAIIEGLAGNSNVSDALKKQYTGEAKFIRAYCHFYLTNLYGEIPLITTTDVTKTALAPRTSIADVYTQITADLLDAEKTLAVNYNYSPTSGDRTRVNKWGAAALLARVYLYRGLWEDAAKQASLVIDSTTLYSLVTDITTSSPFYKNSSEAIWQFYSFINPTNGYTNEGTYFNPATTATSFFVLRPGLLSAFENTSGGVSDKRKSAWTKTFTYAGITYYTPCKYKFISAAAAAGKLEYYTLLRLSEQYLIRAEARAQLGIVTGINSAASDLNVIRTRAGLGNTTANTKTDMLSAIAQERRVELFAELGHRWFDLKRTGSAGTVLGPLKTTWTSTAILYPVPEEAIKTNSNLLPNNIGY